MGKSGRLKRRPTPSSKEKSGGEVASVKDGQVPAKKKTKAQSLGKGSKQPKRRAQEAQELEATQIQNIRDSAAGSSRLNETFEVEFEFFDPEEDDFHSVRDLLCSGTLGSLDLDFSSLANSIVDQVNIGTMVKSGVEEAQQTQTQEAASEEDDVTLCGMLTILNLKQFAEEAWCKTLLALLKLRLDKQLQQYILGPAQASGKEQVGLIISERFVNLPLEVIPAMHNVILEDISWSCSTEYCPPEEPWPSVDTVSPAWSPWVVLSKLHRHLFTLVQQNQELFNSWAKDIYTSYRKAIWQRGNASCCQLPTSKSCPYMSIQCEQRLYACKFTITARYCIQLSKQRGNVKARMVKVGHQQASGCN